MRALATAALVAAVAFVAAVARSEEAAAPDPATVKAKIEALGLRDDLLPAAEQPMTWLRERRDAIMPALLAGLDNPTPRIAEGCLGVLYDAPESKELVDALVRISQNPAHPLRVRATWYLAQYADDPRVPPILEASLGEVMPGAPDKMWELILGVVRPKAAAGELVIEGWEKTLASDRQDQRLRVISRLGDLAYKPATTSLERIAKEPEWPMAGTALLALARIDPETHGLTAGQAAFLRKVTPRIWTDKAGRPNWQEFVAFDRADIRPYVMLMLESDYSEPALEILSMWRDKEALPEIMRIAVKKQSGWRQSQCLASYIRIARTADSVKQALAVMAEDRAFAGDALYGVLRSIAAAEMPVSDKLTILRAFRDNVDGARRLAVPGCLRVLVSEGHAEVLPELLAPLMSEERDLAMLGAYCSVAAADPDKRFATEVRDAFAKAVGRLDDPTASLEGAAAILAAVDAYAIEGAGASADGFFATADPAVRIAAAQVSVRLGGRRPEALRVLYEALASAEVETRKSAAAALATIPCADEAERAAREGFVLSCLGKPSEDYALRVLATCGGVASIKRLLPLLDEWDVPRAIHAAWVLTQIPDKSAYDAGLRCLAVAALFHHQMTQVDMRIHLDIAPDVYLSQVLDRRAAAERNPANVTIPADLLVPFDVDDKERAFAERVYLGTLAAGYRTLSPPVTGLARDGAWPRSWESVLRRVAEMDIRVEPLFVEGRPVVDFPTRRAAAKILQSMTGRPTVGRNFAGQTADLGAAPTAPYEDQDALLAAFVLDTVERYLPLGNPPAAGTPDAGGEWRRAEGFNTMITNLTVTFGNSLRQALIAEAKKRGIESRLRDAHLGLWRDVGR